MEDVFIDRVLHDETFGGVSGETVLAIIHVSFDFRLVSFGAQLYFFSTLMAKYFQLVIYVILTKLISQREPSFPQVVISGEELNLVSSRHEQVYESVNLIRLLGLLPDLSQKKVVGDLGIKLNILVRRALVADQASLRGV